MKAKRQQAVSPAPHSSFVWLSTAALCLLTAILGVSLKINHTNLAVVEARLKAIEHQILQQTVLHDGATLNEHQYQYRFKRGLSEGDTLTRHERSPDPGRDASRLETGGDGSRLDIPQPGDKKLIRNRKAKAKARKRHSRSRKNKTEKRKPKAVHFEAYVDSNRHERLPDDEKTGYYHDGAFVSHDKILKIWKAAEKYDEDVFQFNSSNGRLAVGTGGLYLLYAQVVFMDKASRKSIAIHIGDESKPFVESLSFDSVDKKRMRRTPSIPAARVPDKTTAEVDSLQADRRALYTQCSCMGVRNINKGEQIFIKTLEADRGIVETPYLTYWGVVRIG